LNLGHGSGKLIKTQDAIFPLTDNTNTGLGRVKIEMGSTSLGKLSWTPRMDNIEEELDDLQINKNLLIPVNMEQTS